MNRIALLLMLLTSIAFAHEDHSEKLEAKGELSGKSVLQLKSSWKNQRGESVNLTELKGKARLVVMLFTSCETACPLIVEDVKGIALEVGTKESEKIEVSVFSLDSFRETPESLKEFARKRNLPSHWALFTSNAEAVADLAAALGLRYKRLQNGDFIHSNVIYLLNSEGEVVAQKQGLNTPRKSFVKEIRKIL